MDAAKELMMKKTIILIVILLAVACGLWFQSDLDGQCMKYHADGARWTVNGVYCWRWMNERFREYYLLDELRARHERVPDSPFFVPSLYPDI